MIKSMTGFGKAERTFPDRKISIEIKALNSRQLDISVRLPGLYKEKDIEIRKDISNRLVRGKVDLILHIENLKTESSAMINEALVSSYVERLKGICSLNSLPIDSRLLQVAVRLPDSVKAVYDEIADEEWCQLKEAVTEALEEVDRFRRQEGVALSSDIVQNINAIKELLPKIKVFESERLELLKAKILNALCSMESDGLVDSNRFEQEVLYYLEKLDINEEKVRLTNHCDYFLETMEAEVPTGKKLGFISQEIGREINTIGSKANHAKIQKVVVQMKDALEKVKEQLLNIL